MTPLLYASSAILKGVKLVEGDKVECKWRGGGAWYPGKIASDRGNGTYDISYDDGGAEAGVAENLIRLKESSNSSSSIAFQIATLLVQHLSCTDINLTDGVREIIF